MRLRQRKQRTLDRIADEVTRIRVLLATMVSDTGSKQIEELSAALGRSNEKLEQAVENAKPIDPA